MVPVHPHACGDNESPLLWPGWLAVHPHACGDNIGRRFLVSAVAVHPHACGDNWPTLTAFCVTVGSPPRVWGQLPRPGSGDVLTRFTPTRVGTTQRGADDASSPPVHPHACGDNGNPPYSQFSKWRFTPTRVGTTSSARSFEIAKPVHPHACGDNVGRPTRWGNYCGSPPRVWGQRHILWSKGSSSTICGLSLPQNELSGTMGCVLPRLRTLYVVVLWPPSCRSRRHSRAGG